VPVEEQVVSIYAVTEGHMDDIAIADIRRFEDELGEFFRSRHPGLLSEIRDTGKLPEGDEVPSAIAQFKETFEGSRVEE
jgi:F-type H+-transporting ATPase subunit alpha